MDYVLTNGLLFYYSHSVVMQEQNFYKFIEALLVKHYKHSFPNTIGNHGNLGLNSLLVFGITM